MSRKEMIIETVELVGAKLNKDGIYEMTEEQYLQLDTELGNIDISDCQKIQKNGRF